jgi:hypothetical protein
MSGNGLPGSVVTRPYPVRLDGQFDPPVNPWLWLVKWVLVIPHVVVLLFLWLGVILATFVAGVAILFSGEYPRAIFEYNVGVMRWTWRVGFYAYDALGTDRYPPFTLDECPDYPARLAVDYPEHLSRGLVLVKWWLLAIPQYLVVGLLAGGGKIAGGGLITLLVLVIAVLRLARNEEPTELFDLVIGFNRWCFRVLAYALLMTDDYPPFRLDQGQLDPGHLVSSTV